jgi:peptide deformylase
MSKPSIDDHMTYIQNFDDLAYLRKVLPPVNMRLFRSSQGYREVILRCCKHLEEVALMEFSDYSKPYGISGANVAIPFNIIGLVGMRKLSSAFVTIMINPSISQVGIRRDQRTSYTNCGSVRLEHAIPVKRWYQVLAHWYDTEGVFRGRWFYKGEAATIQHEILHNKGVLITDSENDLLDLALD